MSAASDGSQTTDALGRYVRSMPTPPPQQCRVLSVDEAAAQLGLTRPRTMGLVNSGGIEVASGEHDTLALRVGDGDTRFSMLLRLIHADWLPFDRQKAATLRAQVSALDPIKVVRYPPRLERAALDLLRAEGAVLTRENLFDLIWGERRYLDRMITLEAERDVQATLKDMARLRPPPPDGHHDVPISVARAQLRIFPGRIRRICNAGGIEIVSADGEPLAVRLRINETRESLLERLLTNWPMPFDRPAALRHRELMAAIDPNQSRSSPKALREIVIALLRSENREIDREAVQEIIWIAVRGADSVVRQASRDYVTHDELRRNAGIGRRTIWALRDLGAIELRPHAPYEHYQYLLDEDVTRKDLIERLMKVPSTGRPISDITSYSAARYGLGLDPLHAHPRGILEDVASFLHGRKQLVSSSSLGMLLKGNPDQLSAFAAEFNLRHGIEVHTRRMPVKGRNRITYDEFVERLDPKLQSLAGTGLDVDGHGGLPTATDLTHLSAILDDRLFQVAAIITLHVRCKPDPNERNLHKALCALRNLQGLFHGDFDLSSVVGAVLAAWIETPDASASRRPRMQDVLGWKIAVALYAAFVRTAPAAARSAALMFRIAPPAGSVGFFRHVHKEIAAIDAAGEEDKWDRLEDILNDPERLRDIMFQLRGRTRSLRDHVLAKRDEAIQLGLRFPVEGAMREDFVDVATKRQISQYTTYRIQRWSGLHDQLVECGALASDEFAHPSGFIPPDGSDHLFEHQYALTDYACRGIDGSSTAPLAFVEQFEGWMFHPLRRLSEEEGVRKLKTMDRLGFSMVNVQLASGLWMFRKRERRRMARLIQQRLGLVVIPIMEVDHGQQVAALALSTAYDWPTRSGEIVQLRIDEGKYRIFREPGVEGRICSYRARRKNGERFDELEEDFFMYDRSIDLFRELLGTTSTRIFGGAGIASRDASAHLRARGIEPGHLVYAGFDGSLTSRMVLGLVNACLAGNARIKMKDGKDIWTTIARRAGLDLEERRRASRHRHASTTKGYGKETRAEMQALQQDLARMRAATANVGVSVSTSPANPLPQTDGDFDRRAAVEEAIARIYADSGQDDRAAVHVQEAKRLRGRIAGVTP